MFVSRVHSAIYILLLTVLMGCGPWSLPEREFPVCDTPSAEIDRKANLLTVNFGLKLPNGDIDEVHWNFGDGQQKITTPPELSTTHTYSNPGSYTVTAILRNKCADEVEVVKSFEVSDVTLPLVSTGPATDIRISTATLPFTVSDNGRGSILRSGVCYSTSTREPFVGDPQSVSMTLPFVPLIGRPYSLSASNLKPNTLYYVRAFAENSAGIGYGDPVTFRTWALAGVTTETAITTKNSATVYMRIDSVGNPAATRYGICYSATNTLPTIDDATQPPTFTVVGSSIIVPLSALKPDTRYYYRAFAVNEAGVSYGLVQTLTTQTDVELDRGLIAYYPADNNAEDKSPNKLHGSLLNGATFTTDRNNRANAAFSFDGRNDYFEVPDNALLRPGTLSVGFWIKLTNRVTLTQQSLFTKSYWEDGEAEQYGAVLNQSAQQRPIDCLFGIKQNSDCKKGRGWQTVTGTSTRAPTSDWNHLLFCYEGQTLKIYLNGELLATETRLPLSNTIDDCRGGTLRFAAQSRADPQYLEGSIDDIRLYNRALLDSEIKALAKP
ncbi:PKD domain containing protein [Fibrisoma limi BUZ 3]|uniref:PKD domain containing protein n=1 Tax=Fibrisoma limi BUZ 3 TaxID=1185876 RepID=I2GJW0_9BACT|nr:LamG-like jellyroll fold domain-containing protein [Fibrisoma limi]CCH54185.1 PKD domain containing protein [Fibrisoma limi BUZ 3]